MGFLQSPRLLLSLRTAQLLFAIGFIVLLGWSNGNPGYWTNLQGSVALGVVTFIFTLLATGHAVYEHFRHVEHFRGSVTRVLRIVAEFIFMLMWIGTTTLMLHSPEQDFTKTLIPAPPQVEWDLGIAFAILEIVLFICTTILLVFGLRGGSKSATSSGAYV